MDFTVHQGAIFASGDVIPGDSGRFRALVTGMHPRPSILYLSSDGGSFLEGVKLGYTLREIGFATRVASNTECASACVFAFLGGVIREADGSAKVGVHMASLMSSRNYVQKLKSILLMADIPLDTKISYIIALNEQSAAKAATLEIGYLIKMGVSLRIMNPITDNLQLQIHWLTRQEMRDYNVVNVD